MATATSSAMLTDSVHETKIAYKHRPRRQKKDSFLLFADASIPHNASSEDLSKKSIAERNERSDSEDDPDPLYKRLVMTPLYSISFILSLFLVERSERARRSSEHLNQNQSFWTTFSLQNWLDPEPYQDPNDTTWEATTAGQENVAAAGGVPHPKRKQWYRRKKAMKIGKTGISEAFDLSGTIMVLLLAAGTMIVLGVGWGASKAWHNVTNRWL